MSAPPVDRRPAVEPITPLADGLVCAHCRAPVTGGTRWQDGHPRVLWPCGHTDGTRAASAL